MIAGVQIADIFLRHRLHCAIIEAHGHTKSFVVGAAAAFNHIAGNGATSRTCNGRGGTSAAAANLRADQSADNAADDSSRYIIIGTAPIYDFNPVHHAHLIALSLPLIGLRLGWTRAVVRLVGHGAAGYRHGERDRYCPNLFYYFQEVKTLL